MRTQVVVLSNNGAAQDAPGPLTSAQGSTVPERDVSDARCRDSVLPDSHKSKFLSFINGEYTCQTGCLGVGVMHRINLQTTALHMNSTSVVVLGGNLLFSGVRIVQKHEITAVNFHFVRPVEME